MNQAKDIKKLADYECQVMGDLSKAVDIIIVILHGFGATNADFVSLVKPISQK